MTQEQATPVLHAGDDGKATGRTERTPDSLRRIVTTIAIWIGTLLAVALVTASLLFQSNGGRWFIVETPSMGTTAPVGTLVLTTPVQASTLRVGDIISFHPPTAPREVYTHRIVAISATGIQTRGDINGAVDGWKLGQKDLIGQATTILPGVGWLVRGIPIVLFGMLVVWFALRFVKSRTRRTSYFITGMSLVAALTVYVLKPFVGLIVLQTTTTRHGVDALVVATGLLPIRAKVTGGPHIDLRDGEVATLHVPTMDGGHYAVATSLHLTLLQWIIFGFICALPLLYTFLIGLPPEVLVPLDETGADETSADGADGDAVGSGDTVDGAEDASEVSAAQVGTAQVGAAQVGTAPSDSGSSA